MYEGDRNERGERHGMGVYNFSDGGVYEGEWRHNLQEGYGAMRYASGSLYEGDWKGGMQDGRGVFRFASGSECTPRRTRPLPRASIPDVHF